MTDPPVAPWPPELLAPVLITYNRAQELGHTLEQWAAGPLAGANLLVLDNASSDGTAEVVAAFAGRMPNLGYARNAHNVGGAANILRAVEHGASPYLWIIGDDDRWEPRELGELAAVLGEGRADLIRLGWLVGEASRGRTVSGRQLAATEPLFFPSLSLISSVILRRSLFVAQLGLAYQGASDAYPHLVPMLRALEETDLAVHTLSQDLVVHTPASKPGYFLGDLEWFSYWFRTGRFLEEARLRRLFGRSILAYVTRRDPSWLAMRLVLPMNALRYKALDLPQGPYLASLLGFGEGWRANILLAWLGYALVPRFLAAWLDGFYRPWAGLGPAPQRAELQARRKTRKKRI